MLEHTQRDDEKVPSETQLRQTSGPRDLDASTRGAHEGSKQAGFGTEIMSPQQLPGEILSSTATHKPNQISDLDGLPASAATMKKQIVMASPNDASTVSQHYVSIGGKKDLGESAIKVYQKKQEADPIRRSNEHDTFREQDPHMG